MTGGAGFLGSHLVEELLQLGHETIVLDNLSTGKLDNLATVIASPRFSLEVADIADYHSTLALFEGVDYVFHLAALADIVPSVATPLEYHRSNVDGTINVLEAARQMRTKRLIYAASSSCYGIPQVYPTPEVAEINPQHPYALTKWIAEQYVLHWGKVYKLPVVSLRCFNVYGPRSRTSGAYGAVFGVFLAQKLHGKPFTVVGDGTQTRDFTFVSDVVMAFISAADSAIRDEILNVGSGHTYSVNQLVGLLGGDVTYIPKRPGEPDCTHADISKIKRVLGWEPAVSFEEGVQKLLACTDYWRDAPVWSPESIAEASRPWFEYLS